LQQRTNIAYLFISHDLAVIRSLSHRIIVLNAGRIVEAGPAAEILMNPEAPYTKTLLAAAGL
jgi:ABC-type microcin C transport system duplicated ATPase subunit YejF